jgi:hypothetical protein
VVVTRIGEEVVDFPVIEACEAQIEIQAPQSD